MTLQEVQHVNVMLKDQYLCPFQVQAHSNFIGHVYKTYSVEGEFHEALVPDILKRFRKKMAKFKLLSVSLTPEEAISINKKLSKKGLPILKNNIRSRFRGKYLHYVTKEQCDIITKCIPRVREGFQNEERETRKRRFEKEKSELAKFRRRERKNAEQNKEKERMIKKQIKNRERAMKRAMKALQEAELKKVRNQPDTRPATKQQNNADTVRQRRPSYTVRQRRGSYKVREAPISPKPTVSHDRKREPARSEGYSSSLELPDAEIDPLMGFIQDKASGGNSF